MFINILFASDTDVRKFLIKILKKNSFTYKISLKVYRFYLSLHTKIEKFFHKKKILDRLKNRKKIDFKTLYYGKLKGSEKASHMEKLLLSQIERFKKTGQEKFMLLEIGTYMGESLELFGNILNKNLRNYLIVAIDPYSEFASEKDIERKNVNYEMSKEIEKIYLYYLHNVSLMNWRENMIHIRKNSSEGLKLVQDLKLSWDFIYIDGSHYYEGIKHDFLKSKELIKKIDNYKGIISGDDFELEINECKKYGYSKDEFKKFLQDKKEVDYLIMEKNKGLGFHPGITLYFSEINDTITKTQSGFWYLDNIQNN